MGLLDLFKKKGSSDVAKDRLKLLLVSDESDTNNGSVPAIFANIPIKDMRNSEK